MSDVLIFLVPILFILWLWHIGPPDPRKMPS